MNYQGLVPAAPDAARPPIGVPPRRRRRVAVGQELATPLAASFLGLLLVHGLGSAEAAVPGAASAGTGEPDPIRPDDDGAAMGSIGSALPAAVVPMTMVGAHTGANLIDASMLTRLAGEASFVPTTAQVTLASVGGAGMSAAAAPSSSPSIELGITQASLELSSLALEPGGQPDPDPDDAGPIGRYVRGDGTDRTVTLTDDDDIFVGGDGDEHVLGGGGDDHLDGAGGEDHLEGGAGNDTLLGGTGDDLLEGGAGDDRLDGGLDDDRLAGGAGNDHLQGGGGNDSLDGGTGTDLLEGGTGNEILVLADVRDAVTEMALGSDGGGNDTVVVADGYGRSLAAAMPATHGEATFVLGRPDLATFPQDFAAFRQQIDPDIENIRLEGSFDHDVVGDGRDSVIVGNAGDNRIFGGAGEDDIWGGDGDDWLDGGDGGDTLYGGGGDDTFVLGLHESGDQVFDHEGRNTLRLIGADPDQLSAVMQGDDLVLTSDDRVVATVDDYAHHADRFVGIDLGHGVRALDDFMAEPAARTMAQAESGDWLAEFLPPRATGDAEPLAEPWSTMADTDATGGISDLGLDSPSGSAAGGAGIDQPDPLTDTAFTVDTLAGADDLWLPVDPLAEPSFDAAERETVAARAGEERVHST